jgi:POT family proton-dependent oligopeptide transporter
MVGRLAPLKYQGVMMGAWMLVTGVASIMSSYFSSFIPEASAGNAAATNPVYSKIFGSLGWSSVAVGVLLVLLIPILRRLISDKASDKVTSEINADTEREIEAGMSHAHSNAG